MTKSNLLQIAETIKKTAIPEIIDLYAPSLGTTYESQYLGKPILLYVNSRGEPLALYYQKVMYRFASTEKKRMHQMKEFYTGRNCDTQVYLYNNTRMVAFQDEEGVVHYDKTDNPVYGDYCTVIPLPLPPA